MIIVEKKEKKDTKYEFVFESQKKKASQVATTSYRRYSYKVMIRRLVIDFYRKISSFYGC